MSDMANYWAEKDWKVVLATWSGPEVVDFYPLHTQVKRVYVAVRTHGARQRSRIRANFTRIADLRRLLKSVRPDVALSFMTESNLLTILAGVRLDVKVVVSERVQPALHEALPRTWRMLRRFLYVRADSVVAQTCEAALWLERNCRTTATVIPNALRGLPEPCAKRGNVIVAVGRLTYQKGFDLLLRAFSRVAPDFGDWRVAIVGEGEERQRLTELRGQLRLEDRVEFVGQTSDVVTWMAHAGLVVQPSRFEGFPNVVLESMGLGAAVISADCPSGPSDLIEEGINGRLVPVEDVDTLAAVMADLMSRPDERARLGRAACGVRARFRQDTVMALWEKCLFPRATRKGLPGADSVSEYK